MEDGWINWPELRRLSRHFSTSIVTIGAFVLLSYVITFFVRQPIVKNAIETVDGVVVVGILAVLGLNILKEFWKGGSSYVLAALA